jgi:hypothetical protein
MSATSSRAAWRKRTGLGVLAALAAGLALSLPASAAGQERGASVVAPLFGQIKPLFDPKKIGKDQGSSDGSGKFDITKAISAKSGKAPARRSFKSYFQRIDWTMTVMLGCFLMGGLVAAVVLIKKYRDEHGGGSKKKTADSLGGYTMKNLMMTGQTSQVWEIVENSSGRHFALKLLLPEKLRDPDHVKMLYNEAEVGMKLAHPNIIRIIKLVRDAENPHFIMEFFPAGNLKLRIMHKKTEFLWEKGQDIFKQVATGLAYMHANGYVHRDVKPDNIMVNSAGEVRLIDFALAQRISKGGLFRKRRGRSAGTRSYMSPEQIRGEGLDGRADIYSFAVSFYEVLTGRPPFRAATPSDLLKKQMYEKAVSPQIYNPNLTDECAAFLLRMLSKRKEDRPRDCHEVLMQLRNLKIFKEALQKTS